MNQESERPFVGIGIIVLRDGKVLIGRRLSKRGENTYQIPGGYLEYGQSIPQCAETEVREETGVEKIKIIDVISINNEIAYGKHLLNVGVLAEWVSGEPYDAEPDESANWQWYLPNEIPEPLFAPSKGVLEAWKNKKIYTEIRA